MKLKIKKGDTVKVIAGADKGKSGVVLDVNPNKLKIKVQGIRMQTKLDRKENKLIQTEGFLDYSNVQPAVAAKAAKAKKKTKKSTQPAK